MAVARDCPWVTDAAAGRHPRPESLTINPGRNGDALVIVNWWSGHYISDTRAVTA